MSTTVAIHDTTLVIEAASADDKVQVNDELTVNDEVQANDEAQDDDAASSEEEAPITDAIPVSASELGERNFALEYVLKNPHSNHVDLEDPDHANFKLATSFIEGKVNGINHTLLIEFDSSSVQNQLNIEEVL